MNKRSSIFNRILHEITMFYVILVMPSILIYVCLAFFTDLKGTPLLYSVLPAAFVLLVLYIIHFVRPVGFIRFWIGEAQFNHMLNLKSKTNERHYSSTTGKF